MPDSELLVTLSYKYSCEVYPMGTLTIHLDDKLERELNRLAKTQHKTKSEIACELLHQHILVRELDDLRNKLRPYAEAAGHLTDADFFRDIS